MSKLIEDALRATFSFIGQSVQFVVGLLGVVLVTALSLSGEILDDIANYQTPVDWGHVAKVVIPPCSGLVRPAGGAEFRQPLQPRALQLRAAATGLAASASAAALSVTSQVKVSSVRPKWPNEAVLR